MTARMDHWFKRRYAIAAALCLTAIAFAEEAHMPVTHAPAVIELHDQFDAPQRLAFPATNITVLTIADKKASDQVDGWVDALGRYTGRVDLRGMADTSSMPGFLHGFVRHEIRRTRKFPVMLDWSGKVCAQMDFHPGCVNVFVLDRNGSILGHIIGAAAETNRNSVFAVVDRALSTQVSSVK